jgi:hypothetical protein
MASSSGNRVPKEDVNKTGNKSLACYERVIDVVPEEYKTMRRYLIIRDAVEKAKEIKRLREKILYLKKDLEIANKRIRYYEESEEQSKKVDLDDLEEIKTTLSEFFSGM